MKRARTPLTRWVQAGDEWRLCLSEIKTAYDTVRDLQQKGVMNGKGARVSMTRFVWIDDGKTEGKINVKRG